MAEPLILGADTVSDCRRVVVSPDVRKKILVAIDGDGALTEDCLLCAVRTMPVRVGPSTDVLRTKELLSLTVGFPKDTTVFDGRNEADPARTLLDAYALMLVLGVKTETEFCMLDIIETMLIDDGRRGFTVAEDLINVVVDIPRTFVRFDAETVTDNFCVPPSPPDKVLTIVPLVYGKREDQETLSAADVGPIATLDVPPTELVVLKSRPADDTDTDLLIFGDVDSVMLVSSLLISDSNTLDWAGVTLCMDETAELFMAMVSNTVSRELGLVEDAPFDGRRT